MAEARSRVCVTAVAEEVDVDVGDFVVFGSIDEAFQVNDV